ncbi:ATP phosphoribosyltransferase [Clostridium estertheticum]|uniref:ATP phosphoribosyltransferase n=1 Tax=Clostridium estertheticum TaxID=238834 RepID=UPI001C0ACE55|nr:ATP phosphoribosyltransferase [Clostridium estertheticum]MBU3075096.1 ATP phosphoribosyltransferase [Clostridium estertheticum]MBU3165311.1 ATP phosphoribosyltransferase [Clostridium estertheticum]
MKVIRIALTKGRLEKYAVSMFEDIGIDCTDLKNKGRKLILKDVKNNIEFVLVKSTDVLTYVEHGAADIGIVGKDTLMEQNKEFYEVVDLKVGKCMFAVAALPSFKSNDGYNRKKIATKYPTVAKEYFKKNNEDVEIIKLDGSVELAPILELSDAIVDLVETGDTLRENGLIIIEKIYDISARMIVNRASMKMKKDEIGNLIVKVQQYVDKNEAMI